MGGCLRLTASESISAFVPQCLAASVSRCPGVSLPNFSLSLSDSPIHTNSAPENIIGVTVFTKKRGRVHVTDADSQSLYVAIDRAAQKTERALRRLKERRRGGSKRHHQGNQRGKAEGAIAADAELRPQTGVDVALDAMAFADAADALEGVVFDLEGAEGIYELDAFGSLVGFDDEDAGRPGFPPPPWTPREHRERD